MEALLMENTNLVTDNVKKDWRITVMEMILAFLIALGVSDTLARRIFCLIMICCDIDVKRIMEVTGFCKKTVTSLRTKVRNGDFTDLLVVKGGGRKRSLAEIEDEIIQMIETENFFTQQQIVDAIYDRHKITTSKSNVKRLLKRHGYKRLRSGSLPAKADIKKQRDTCENVIWPLMEKAKDVNSNVVMLFMDAAHFVIGCDFLGSIYCKTRRFITTFSGRNRYNVLGAIDFYSKEVYTVTNDTYITATQICEMFRKIVEAYPGKEIHIVLDNARYQKCAIVLDLAKELGIHLEYIPPYSPNLNLIERLWKFVKGELRTKFYSDFSEFKKRINDIIASTAAGEQNHDRIKNIISENIQLFDEMERKDEHTLQVVPKEKAA